jgi:hypothetical protein
MNGNAEDGWEAATWEGSRRAQLRRALTLTVRERLEVLEALAEASGKLGEARLRGTVSAGAATSTESRYGCGSPDPPPTTASRDTNVHG